MRKRANPWFRPDPLLRYRQEIGGISSVYESSGIHVNREGDHIWTWKGSDRELGYEVTYQINVEAAERLFCER